MQSNSPLNRSTADRINSARSIVFALLVTATTGCYTVASVIRSSSSGRSAPLVNQAIPRSAVRGHGPIPPADSLRRMQVATRETRARAEFTSCVKTSSIPRVSDGFIDLDVGPLACLALPFEAKIEARTAARRANRDPGLPVRIADPADYSGCASISAGSRESPLIYVTALGCNSSFPIARIEARYHPRLNWKLPGLRMP